MVAGRAVALWGAQIKSGETMFPAAEFTEFPAPVHITMAAIDPTAEPSSDGPKRATLKIIRRPTPMYNMDDESDEDDEEEDSEDDVSEEEREKEKNKGGKNGAEKSKGDKMDVDRDEKKTGKKGKGDNKGVNEESDLDVSDDDDEEGLEIEEFVLCTLDAEKHYQQALDITIGDDEEIFFRASGAYDVFLTGNYVDYSHDHGDEGDEESEDDYDLSPSEGELYGYGESESEDELDDIENPRIQELHSDEEEDTLKKKSGDKKAEKKKLSEDKSKKRAAEETPEKPAEDSKKKLKSNQGKSVSVDTLTPAKKEDKKVKFAKNLEQGPTPSPASKKQEQKKSEEKKADKKAEGKKEEKKEEKKSSTPIATRKVNGVTIEDRTIGTGPSAKTGNKVQMRYVGKLNNGKIFDSNTKGKPFSFTLGKGEVIKGWDVGIAGMQKGGERRLIIPAEMAYGKKAMAGIPANSTLTFDVKLLGIK
ncbi:hypothetical protein BDZ91DRAFT_209319 [Kalaharituber pfeilii]|nr:hypothetical protein BDZ91DRAFT_209319 [Kalaharituber pfeilii]